MFINEIGNKFNVDENQIFQIFFQQILVLNYFLPFFSPQFIITINIILNKERKIYTNYNFILLHHSSNQNS